MNTAICAIAKYENVYINDWVNYHLNLGFDHIYIYDDNEDDYPYVGDCIDNKENITIIKFNFENGKDHIKNAESSYDFLIHYAKEYDWVAIIDIDEFIHINCDNIKTYLSNAPYDCYFIAFTWRIFGDSNIIIGDESVPVYNRLRNDSFSNISIYKTIFRVKKDNINYIVQNPHSLTFNGEDFNYYDSNFNKNYVSPLELNNCNPDNYDCYIEHYYTKTLSEFIKYKYPRFSKEQGDDPFEYYFIHNKKTPEKIAYIKEKLNIDIQ